MNELKEWESFYLIVGSGAGALIGLQFVMLTLIAERPRPNIEDATASFTTPTVVHFCVAVFLSAIHCAPWHSITPIALLWGLVALYGLGYTYIVVWRMRRQTAYQPGLEDWCYHAVLPMTVYALIGAMSVVAEEHLRGALFGVAAAALGLLFIGIHNAWDAVVYYVMALRQPEKKGER